MPDESYKGSAMQDQEPRIRHIAFIPDGNRRWARDHKIRNLLGHRMGFETIRRSYDWLIKRNIEYATFYVFSEENWKRSSAEINYLLNLFRCAAEEMVKEFPEKGIRFRFIGNIESFPPDIQKYLLELTEKTKNNTVLNLIVAIGYSGREEIVRAARKIADDVKNNRIEPEDVSEKKFISYLDTYDIPDPDIIVRTSECRISNFLLWQMSYSEIFFVDKYWPDFNEQDFDNIITGFSHRVRRYGK